MKKFVSYLRVSTDKQGRSGLGMEAQREAVNRFLNGGEWKLVREYVEENGKNDARPQLRKALHHAKVTGATLVIAKLDRLSRNVGFIDRLQEAKVRFVCADMPEANETMIGFMAVMAKHERKAISERTSAALNALRERLRAGGKTRGGRRRLGNPNGARALRKAAKGNSAAVEAIQAGADRRAREDFLPVVDDIRAAGIVTLKGIAEELNAREILTARRGKWHPSTVKRLIERA